MPSDFNIAVWNLNATPISRHARSEIQLEFDTSIEEAHNLFNQLWKNYQDEIEDLWIRKLGYRLVKEGSTE